MALSLRRDHGRGLALDGLTILPSLCRLGHLIVLGGRGRGLALDGAPRLSAMLRGANAIHGWFFHEACECM